MQYLSDLAENLLNRKRLIGLFAAWMVIYFLAVEILLYFLPIRLNLKFYLSPLMQGIGVASAVITIGLICLCVYHFNNKMVYLSDSTRWIWNIIFVFSGLFGIPVYCYRYILRSGIERTPHTEFRWAVGILIGMIFAMFLFLYYNFKGLV